MVALHHPFHDREHLLRARDVDDLQVGDGIEGCAVVVAHMRRAVRARLEVGGRCEECDVEPVPLAQPSVLCAHGLQTLLVAHCDPPHHLPIEERTEGAAPRVVAQRRKRL